MSVAYRRWELGGGAPGVGYKITGSSPAQVHLQYGSDGSAVLRRQQQHQPHEPCNLSSFSIYMQQCPAAAAAAGSSSSSSSSSTATSATPGGENHKIHIPGSTVRLSSPHHPQSSPIHWESHADASEQAMATVSSTLSHLPEAQEKVEEQRWGMMGGGAHKPSTMRLNVPQYYSVQGGLSLMMSPKESATGADCTPLQKVESHTRVVGVLPETVPGQCVKESPPSPSSSSSICDGREHSSCSSQDTSGDVEAQSAYRGPLDQMSALESSLPIKRPGLSKFFGGKSRSFSSLADVSSVSDLAKPNNPYAKRRRLGLNAPLDRHRSYPPISRASVAGISKKPANRSSTLTVAVKLGGLTDEDKDYAAALPGSSRISLTRTTPSRSFSLTDLPVVSNPSSPPFRRSFAQP